MVKAYWWMAERPLLFALFVFALALLDNGARAILGDARPEKVLPVSFGMAFVTGVTVFLSKKIANAPERPTGS